MNQKFGIFRHFFKHQLIPDSAFQCERPTSRIERSWSRIVGNCRIAHCDFRVAGALLLCCLALSGCGAFVINQANAGASLTIPASVSFGAVSVGQMVSAKVSLTNKSAAPIVISQLEVSGESFSLSGQGALPLTLDSGQSYSFNVRFDPGSTGAATGQVVVTSKAFTASTSVIRLNGTGKAVAVNTPLLTFSASDLSFGSVGLNSPSTETLTLKSSGTAQVSVSGATVTGTGFSISGATFPLTLNPGQTATLKVQFDPTTAGAATGQLTISSNSSTNGSAVIPLSGTGTTVTTGVPKLSISLTSVTFGSVVLNTPATASVLLSSTGGVPVTISAAALTGAGFKISGITFPAVLNPGQTATLNLQFEPTALGAVTGQLTITSNSATNSSAVIALTGSGVLRTVGTPTLTINGSSVTFGVVLINTPATQSLTLTSSGTAPVTISAISLTGTGFKMSATSVPVTLNPGQSITINIQFELTGAGSVTGALTIASNSSSGNTVVIPMSGTGVLHEVGLTWDPPSNSPVTISGYNVYRSQAGSSTFQLLNLSVEGQTTFVDGAVQSGQSYDYVVKAVDGSGVESAPSNLTSVTIP